DQANLAVRGDVAGRPYHQRMTLDTNDGTGGVRHRLAIELMHCEVDEILHGGEMPYLLWRAKEHLAARRIYNEQIVQCVKDCRRPKLHRRVRDSAVGDFREDEDHRRRPRRILRISALKME